MTEERATILVVEDSDDVREFYKLVLTGAGYEVATASNGEEAIQRVRQQRPRLIVLDVAMPVMDGLDFLTRLRSDFAPPVPPVILNSGFDITEAEALHRGAAAFMSKPVNPDALLAFVDRILRGAALSSDALNEQRRRANAARARSRRAAADLVMRLTKNIAIPRALFDELTTSQLDWLADYFGVEAVVLSLMRGDRLQVIESAGAEPFALGEDVAARLPLCNEILETGSSLMVADTGTHPSFTGNSFPSGVRFFAGVPVVAPEGAAVGVLFLLDGQGRTIFAEDILILEQLGRIESSVLGLLAEGRPTEELPTTFKAGLLLRRTFELLLDAEARLLQRQGGSLELTVVELADVDRICGALKCAGGRTRMAAGALDGGRVAIFARDEGDAAEARVAAVLKSLRASGALRAAGFSALTGRALPPIPGLDLLRFAELELDQAQRTGGSRRLSLSHEVSQSVPPQ
jgi:DNA-binding response OmpR family regulator